MSVSSPVIIALDFPELASVEQFVAQLDPTQCRLKVGKELFTRFGPDVVRRLQSQGFEIFLDLKFHDIPNTVAAAVAAAADLGVWMVNVHASGGATMMAAARKALLPFGQDAPLLTAVTVLTSMSSEELKHIGVQADAQEQVSRLAALAAESGIDGVVCSAWEAEMLKLQRGEDFVLVTPGIRPEGADSGDQKRIATPARAIEMGSHYLVVGRPITRSDKPMDTLAAINQSLS